MEIRNWKHWAVGGVAALAIMAGGSYTADNVSAAAPVPLAADAAGATDAGTLQFVGQGRGARMGGQMNDMNRLGRFGDFGARAEQGQTLLAEALGVTVEELETAQDQARSLAQDAAISQAVADGELTQEQADAIQELEGLWGDRGFGGPRVGGTRGLGVNGDVSPRMALDEHDAYLAEALGISVEELEAAKEAALQAGIDQAVADGTITEEQAGNLRTELALKDYVADELESVLDAAIAQAVADGVVTQEQADALLDEWQGLGRRGAKGSMRGSFGPGMSDGMRGQFPGGRWNDFDHSPRGMFRGGQGNNSATPDTQGNPNLALPDATSL